MAADTYEVLDGSIRLQVARQRRHGLDMIKCCIVHDITQAAQAIQEAADQQARPMTLGEMAWRCWHLTDFGKRCNHRNRKKVGVRSDYRAVIRPALAQLFDTNEQAIYRLVRIYQASTDPDDEELAKRAQVALEQISAGVAPVGKVYVELFPSKSRLYRNPDKAKVMPDRITPVDDPTAQRRSFGAIVATLNGTIVTMETLQNPAPQLTDQELQAWRKSLVVGRSSINRLIQSIDRTLTDRKEHHA